MPVKLKPTSLIKARLGLQPNGPMQKFFTNECYKAMDKFVPKDIGNLRTNVDIQADSITYESPYASYQYYGMRQDKSHKVKHYTTAGTGKYWDKRMWSVKGKTILAKMQGKIKSGGK